MSGKIIHILGNKKFKAKLDKAIAEAIRNMNSVMIRDPESAKKVLDQIVHGDISYLRIKIIGDLLKAPIN